MKDYRLFEAKVHDRVLKSPEARAMTNVQANRARLIQEKNKAIVRLIQQCAANPEYMDLVGEIYEADRKIAEHDRLIEAMLRDLELVVAKYADEVRAESGEYEPEDEFDDEIEEEEVEA